jgi:putative PIN family toxin of toxin-antitoxin system
MRVILDANVVASAVCWDGEAYRCLVKLARRQIFAYGTIETVQETSDVTSQLIRENKPRHKAIGRLNWYLERIRMVDAAPLGKQRSRDARDDPYLAAAIAARAEVLVSYDKDLLVLDKPFGIEVIRPAQLLRRIKG